MTAESEVEILNQAAEHARTEHNLQDTPEMAEQIRTLIIDDEAA